MQLAAAIDNCQTLICNDSGPMHLAAALATPVVALFGPSDENRTGPWAPPERKRVVRAPGSTPWKRFRPDSTEPRTMDRISVASVVSAAEELLNSED
jgi:ADP-heptose:LPS heptosyltransferase